jgi:carboxypeptidase Taq
MTTYSKDVQQALDGFRALDEKIANFEEILHLANWDLNTCIPKKGREQRSNAIGLLETQIFEWKVSPEMASYLSTLSADDALAELDEETKAAVLVRKKEHDKVKSIPKDLYREYAVHAAKAQGIWEDAREADDFNYFAPALEKMVDLMRQFTEHMGYDEHPYDALLDLYEPGLTVGKLEPLFTELKASTLDLLRRIEQSPHQPKREIFQQKFDLESQKKFNRLILPYLGYDFEAGRLDESAHPFASGINIHDVRITTRYNEEDPRSAIFGTIHECGHALYEQGVNPAYESSALRGGVSMGIHESQSRFLENMVGRSMEFWTFFYADLQQHFPQQLKNVDLEDFFRAINAIDRSLIRVEADELTYNLHIMLRYELEKELISGNLNVGQLPELWKEKMEAYIGIAPTNHADGVLQDIHWSFGGFGYFPSYSLGNLYAAQFLKTIKQEIPDFDTKVRNGEFLLIREWLKEKIHQHGKRYTPNELIKSVTGEELNAKYLTTYLEEKYSQVYQL